MSDAIPGDVLATVRKMREAGIAWKRIAARTGVGEYRLKAALIPGWREKRRDQMREWRGRAAPAKPREVEASIRLPPLPQDNRDLTARLMGDPLPGRSALDRRQSS